MWPIFLSSYPQYLLVTLAGCKYSEIQLPWCCFTKICEKFGTWVTKSMYGKTYKGIERSTFLISKGKVIKVWRKVKVNGHVQNVLDICNKK